MDKRDLVAAIQKKYKIESGVAESAVNDTIAELAAPFILKKAGGEVAFLDNSCSNNCKEPLAAVTNAVNK